MLLLLIIVLIIINGSTSYISSSSYISKISEISKKLSTSTLTNINNNNNNNNNNNKRITLLNAAELLSPPDIDDIKATLNDWNFMDGVYLITTTAKDTPRLDQTKIELSKVGLLDKVQIRTFIPDNEDRVRGCYTSHISVLSEVQKQFKNKKNYKVLILEDNLEVTKRMNNNILESVNNFINDKDKNNEKWDVFHLAYMMYVPGLSLKKLNTGEEWSNNIVQLYSNSESSIGTSAYIISKSGVDAVLKKHKESGFVEAIPNIMALLFPNSRYAAYPMIFHRAGKINSLVNPQLDSFRRIMFSPAMYTTWETLMVSTGLQNNQLFPGITITLLLGTLSAIYSTIVSITSGENSSNSISPVQIFIVFPLFVALWGATLFKPGNTGAGFASSTQKK